MRIKAGDHLRVVRSWIQRRARNGESVTWGSNEILQLNGISVLDLEWLAQDVRTAVLTEMREKLDGGGIQICSEFVPDIENPQGPFVCEGCGYKESLHKIFNNHVEQKNNSRKTEPSHREKTSEWKWDKVVHPKEVEHCLTKDDEFIGCVYQYEGAYVEIYLVKDPRIGKKWTGINEACMWLDSLRKKDT